MRSSPKRYKASIFAGRQSLSRPFILCPKAPARLVCWMGGSQKPKVKVAAAVAVGIAVVVFLIYRARTVGFAWTEFEATFVQVRWTWLLLSVPVILLTYVRSEEPR